ncbi:MAG TPA: T9SS type A sorting domain-containing protein [Bacteroidetes bacterium]|nr:T9SS type A sorting domain-containing protein [Bacteroidota bacterium]
MGMKTFGALRFASLGTILFAFSLVSFAQSYTPFINHSQWFLAENGQKFDWYHIGRDSLINGNALHKVFAAGLPTQVFVREDVGAQQVWLASALGNWTERLLYDFSVQVGDTVELSFVPSGSASFVVTNLDSLNTAMGFMPRISLDNLGSGNPAQLRWTVGVGEERHPFYLDYIAGSADFHLICNYQNGLKLFDDGFSTCQNPPIVGVEEAENGMERLKVFPNPAQGVFSLRTPGKKGVWQVLVIDIFGKEVLKFSQKAGTSRMISVQDWAIGLYLLRLTGPQGDILQKKLRVQ